MASNFCQAFLRVRWQPTIQFVRYRKINIQRPRPPHYIKALVYHVCKPIFNNPIKGKTMQELCDKPNEGKKQDKEVNMYKIMLGKEILNWFNNSKMVMFFNNDSMCAQELFQARVLFHRKNMNLKMYGKGLMNKTLRGTRYENITLLNEGCVGHVFVLFSDETDVKSVFKVSKKLQKFSLIAGIVDDQLLNLTQLEKYNQLPDLQTCQSHLLSTLNSAAQNLVQNLNHHQNSLIQSLNIYIETKSPNDKN